MFSSTNSMTNVRMKPESNNFLKCWNIDINYQRSSSFLDQSVRYQEASLIEKEEGRRITRFSSDTLNLLAGKKRRERDT